MLLRTESGFLISSSILLACIIAPASSSGRFGTAFATPLSNAPPGIAWVHDGRALARGPGPMGTGRIVRGGTGGPQVGISTASSCARAGGADHGNAEILLRGLSSLGLGKGLSLPNVVANAAEVISLGAKVERFIAKQDFSAASQTLCDVRHIRTLGLAELSRLWSLMPDDEHDMAAAYSGALRMLIRDGNHGSGRQSAGDSVLDLAQAILDFAGFLVQSFSGKTKVRAVSMLDKAVSVLIDEEAQEASSEQDIRRGELICDCLTLVANTRASAGDFVGAKDAQAKNLKVKEKIHGHSSIKVCEDVVLLASIARQSGHIDEALLLVERASKIAQRCEANQELVCLVTSEMASVYREKGDLKQALLLSRRVLAIQEELGDGEGEIKTAAAQDAVGLVLLKLGRFEEAEKLHRQALATKQAALGSKHVEAASTLFNLGVCADEAADYAQGKEWKEQAMRILLEALGPDHPQIGVALNGLGESARASGDMVEAQGLFERACDILRGAFGNSHPLLATALNNLAQVQRAQGRNDQALLLLMQSVSIKKEVLPPNHPSIATALSNLASLHEEVYKDLDKSLELRRSAFDMVRLSLGKAHPQLAVHLLNMAVTYTRMGDYESAMGLYEEALEIDELAYGPDHPQVATDLNAMATFRFHIGQWQLSRQLYERALSIRKASLGDDHAKTLSTARNLALVIQQLELSDGSEDRSLAQARAGPDGLRRTQAWTTESPGQRI